MQRLTEKLASYRKQNEEESKEREEARRLDKTPRVVQEFKPVKRNKWKIRTLSKENNVNSVIRRKSFAQVSKESSMQLLNDSSLNQLSPSQRHIVMSKRSRKSTDSSRRHSLHNVFPALPSFKVAIMILSYMAFKGNINLLTGRLSKRTRIFKMMHK